MLYSTVGPGNKKWFEEINSILSFYLQPHTQPAPDIERVAHLRLPKPTDQSALKNAFLGDVQLSRAGQWLDDWDITSQNNGVYWVAAARNKMGSPASHISLSLPHLPRPVVIPSAFSAWWSCTHCPYWLPQYFILFLHWHTSWLLQLFWVPVYTTPRRIMLFKGFLLGLSTTLTWHQVQNPCGVQHFTPPSLHKYTLSILSLLFWHVLLEQ